jgi:uncharacterized protein (DUF433 family)
VYPGFAVSGVAAAGTLAAGETRESILANYPYLEAADIDEVRRYAAPDHS